MDTLTGRFVIAGLPHGAQTALSSVPGVLGRNADDIALLYEGVLTERGIALSKFTGNMHTTIHSALD